MRVYLTNHARALLSALGRLSGSWLPSLMTAAVIGIALALPAAFLLALDNLRSVTGSWDGQAQASLFIHKDVAEADYRRLAERLRGEPDIAGVQVITPGEALDEFQQRSGLEEAVALLEENPLPPVLVVEPARGLGPAAIQGLGDRLGGLAEVDRVRLDREWVKRLHALMVLVGRGVWIVAALLGLAVVLVVGNTIRLDIENRREEIVIEKLIGGTDAFIRRPFLYEGAWYGLLGGVLAAILLEAGRALLNAPADDLAQLYGSGFTLRGLSLRDFALLLGVGAGLGWAGSWLAVGRHLAAIEPR